MIYQFGIIFLQLIEQINKTGSLGKMKVLPLAENKKEYNLLNIDSNIVN